MKRVLIVGVVCVPLVVLALSVIPVIAMLPNGDRR